ncbi:hypothetical protein COCNU_09G002650 [Cocos nucifera]|uniref:Uncharacterized protein n=1 Tax=Cocos nucifera TaxID=13894 RepID=A0A8K0IJ67_COCNU|nr:hypothetical protein COCNU_09G002650 [Cocos nucifera]
MLAAGEEVVWLHGRRAVGEGGAALDEGLVCEVAIGDEDGWARGDAKCYDGAMLRMELSEDVFDVEDGFPLPYEPDKEGNGGWTRRKPSVLVGVEEDKF